MRTIRTLIFFLIFTVLSVGSSSAEPSEIPSEYLTLMNIDWNLEEIEISEISSSGSWDTGITSTGGAPGVSSVSFKVEYSGISMIVQMALFDTVDEAKRAAAILTLVINDQFYPRSFAGEACPGTSCWSSEGGCLIVQSENLCIKVYGSRGDSESTILMRKVSILEVVDVFLSHFENLVPLKGYSVDHSNIVEGKAKKGHVFFLNESDVPGMVLVEEGAFEASGYLAKTVTNGGEPWLTQYFRSANQEYDELFVLHRDHETENNAREATELFAPLDEISSMDSLERYGIPSGFVSCPGDECRLNWLRPQFSLFVRQGSHTIIVKKLTFDRSRETKIETIEQCFRLAEIAVSRLHATQNIQGQELGGGLENGRRN